MGNRVTDTVIEVIDVARRELLARRQFDEAIGPVGEGLVGVWRDGPDGETIIDVLRLDLAVNRSR